MKHDVFALLATLILFLTPATAAESSISVSQHHGFAHSQLVAQRRGDVRSCGLYTVSFFRDGGVVLLRGSTWVELDAFDAIVNRSVFVNANGQEVTDWSVIQHFIDAGLIAIGAHCPGLR